MCFYHEASVPKIQGFGGAEKQWHFEFDVSQEGSVDITLGLERSASFSASTKLGPTLGAKC